MVRARAKRAHAQAQLLPRLKVVGRGNGTAGAQVLADRPVLGEGLAIARDGSSIGAGSLVDVVGGAVGSELADVGQVCAGVVL